VRIEKYYLDVITPEGGGCIGYTARVDGAGLRVSLAALLAWPHDVSQPTRQRRTWRATFPQTSADGIRWQCPGLHTAGEWRPLETAWREETLLAGAEGTLQWQVLAPRARASLSANGEHFTGLGYAERLRMDFAPWLLPIDGLRWGRFVSARESLVWIEWNHAQPRRWLWRRGRPLVPVEIGDRGLRWPGGSLAIAAPRTLRTGRVGETVFARLGGARRWLPAWLRAVDETKWCARGVLETDEGLRDTGWVIHEVVRFH
jgi:hypothetical protein